MTADAGGSGAAQYRPGDPEFRPGDPEFRPGDPEFRPGDPEPPRVAEEMVTAEDASAASAPLLRPSPSQRPVPSPSLAAWALAFSIAGLIVSLFVGWGFPIGLLGAVAAIVALRRPLESRSIAVWALVLGLVSVLYSAGWLLWAASRTNLLG